MLPRRYLAHAQVARLPEETGQGRRGAFVRRARWWLVLIAAIPLCTAIGLAVAYHFLTPPQWSGEAIAFYAGSGVTGAVFLLILALRFDGAQNLRDGADAEDSTHEALRRHSKAGWTVIRDVPVYRSNIDHVLVGPQGAIALETKRTEAEWQVTEKGIFEMGLHGRLRPRPVAWPIAAARRHAWDLHVLLLAAGVRVQVHPVLVLWGPNLTGIEGGSCEVAGVTVVLGGQAKEWVGALAGPTPLGPRQIELACAGLRARQEGRTVRSPKRPRTPLSAPLVVAEAPQEPSTLVPV